ncbi:hypothetical protein [Candidatus Tisiphia endosymbiont of Temnostethus pusillus]|uniref:hypothetical protein n=1 Tax=Candidatus Tisiphia endosymbiont of Temnostethus pusillus TaxID=3139335 RepID=UPI0035C89EDD
MKINNKILNILVTLVLFLTNHHIWAIEFKTEQEKSIWIKNFFKDKEMAPMEYPIKATEEEKQFKSQLINDFINQNDIEHIEPIARGKSVSDSEIAKYNTACPDKKPIDMYKWWPTLGSDYYTSEEIERLLEDPNNEYVNNIDIYRCYGKIEIYRLNVLNTSDDNQEYVLYCDDRRAIRSWGRILDINRQIEDSSIVGYYLKFDPNKCLYSQEIFTTYPLWGEAVSGIFNYQGKNYFYRMETTNFKSEGEVTDISIQCGEGKSRHKFFGAKTKGRLK